jgi:hypothetical protein
MKWWNKYLGSTSTSNERLEPHCREPERDREGTANREGTAIGRGWRSGEDGDRERRPSGVGASSYPAVLNGSRGGAGTGSVSPAMGRKRRHSSQRAPVRFARGELETKFHQM